MCFLAEWELFQATEWPDIYITFKYILTCNGYDLYN